MNLAICIPVWTNDDHDKQWLTSLCIWYYSRMFIADATIRLYVATSTEEDHQLVRTVELFAGDDGSAFMFSGHIDVPNVPLGRKKNKLFKAAALDNPDAIIDVGSDDFLSPSYFDAILSRLHNKGPQVIRLDHVTYFDAATGRATYCEPANPGAGRCLNRKVYKALRGDYFEDTFNRWMDTALQARLDSIKNLTTETIPSEGIGLIDVKTRTNIWSYEDIRAMYGINARSVDWTAEHLRKSVFPGWLIDELMLHPFDCEHDPFECLEGFPNDPITW